MTDVPLVIDPDITLVPVHPVEEWHVFYKETSYIGLAWKTPLGVAEPFGLAVEGNRSDIRLFRTSAEMMAAIRELCDLREANRKKGKPGDRVP